MTALRPPDGRQGPGPMPGALLRMLDLALVRRAGGTLPGDHLAPGAGTGTELVQLRPYQVGDDVRQIDAAATARTGVPHVRLQVPERTLTTWLVIDVSPSMAFGTARRLKADVAEGVAIAVARLATRRGGRAGLLRAGAADDLLLPPRGGRHAQLAIERVVRRGRGRRCRCDPERPLPCVGAGRPGGAPPGAGRRGLGFQGGGLASAARSARRAAQRGGGRGVRPARGGAAERRPPRARRPRDRRPRRGGQLARAGARAVRRARGRAARGGRRRPSRRRRRPRRPRHRPRLAPSPRPRVRQAPRHAPSRRFRQPCFWRPAKAAR